jgi:hypothetical protein
MRKRRKRRKIGRGDEHDHKEGEGEGEEEEEEEEEEAEQEKIETYLLFRIFVSKLRARTTTNPKKRSHHPSTLTTNVLFRYTQFAFVLFFVWSRPPSLPLPSLPPPFHIHGKCPSFLPSLPTFLKKQ